MVDPKQDGKDHINIHPKSATWLGKFLSHRTLCELNLPEGRFFCISAYWYSLLSISDNRLYYVYDWETDLLATQLIPLPKKEQLPTTEIQIKIKKAIDQKLKWSDYWKEEFTESTLPFKQYYFDSDNNIVDESKKYKWLLDHLESRRILLKQRKYEVA